MPTRAVVVVVLISLLTAGLGLAQESAAPTAAPSPRWWAGVGAGAAWMSSEQPPLADRGATWRLDLFAGLKASPRVWLGFKLGGVGLEAGNLNDPSQGESVSEFLAVVEVHAAGRRGFFAAGGAGWSSYTSGDPAWFDHEGDGWALEAAVGHVWPISVRWGIAPTLSYSRGSIAARGAGVEDLDYGAVAVSVRLVAF
jgi:hypothetical protein